MTALKKTILEGAAEIQQDLDTVLEGMDYCLDWKPSEDQWCAREILWHIIEDPEGGIPNTIKSILSGSLQELEIIADETHMSSDREQMDLDTIRKALNDYFAQMDHVLSESTDKQIQEQKVSCWFPKRQHREERSAQDLLEGLFLRHWREHIAQIKGLREDLGLN
ncbi:DinB family protein [SAR202 cluster bacterium AD-804-J14_MRT_500m]|nr:DinB family protein [SAR202 cluster bacterium AD-804-J14_MRT_500m]